MEYDILPCEGDRTKQEGEMAERLGDVRTGEEEECQAVFAAGGMVRVVSLRILFVHDLLMSLRFFLHDLCQA
jgi:hypothetical protein